MDSCSLSWSTSYFAEIARPSRALALSPFCRGNVTSFSAFASSACSGSSYFCAQPSGTANTHETRNATAIVPFLMVCSPRLWLVVLLRLPLQHRVESVKDRHAPLEQLLILLGARREASDGEIDARGLVAGELAVVQISLVDDLRNDFHAPVLDPEPTDQRLERAVLAMVSEVGAQDIEFRLRIVETPDEPG